MNNQENKLQKMLSLEKVVGEYDDETEIYNDAIKDCKAILGKVILNKDIAEALLDDREIRVFANGDYLNAKITGKTAHILAELLASNFQDLLVNQAELLKKGE